MLALSNFNNFILEMVRNNNVSFGIYTEERHASVYNKKILLICYVQTHNIITAVTAFLVKKIA